MRQPFQILHKLRAVAPGTLIVTDDWSGYADLRKRGYDHHAIAECGDSEVTDEFLPIIHLVFANLKTWLTGIHHGVSERYKPTSTNSRFGSTGASTRSTPSVRCSASLATQRRRPMPSFIPATGITLHLAGVCVNRIGVVCSNATRPPARLGRRGRRFGREEGARKKFMSRDRGQPFDDVGFGEEKGRQRKLLEGVLRPSRAFRKRSRRSPARSLKSPRPETPVQLEPAL